MRIGKNVCVCVCVCVCVSVCVCVCEIRRKALLMHNFRLLVTFNSGENEL
jgi:hypothetical protein